MVHTSQIGIRRHLHVKVQVARAPILRGSPALPRHAQARATFDSGWDVDVHALPRSRTQAAPGAKGSFAKADFERALRIVATAARPAVAHCAGTAEQRGKE